MPEPTEPPASEQKHVADPTNRGPMVPEDQIAGDMHTEEPTGWDLAPQGATDVRAKRHPRPDGEGGIQPAAPKYP